MKPYTILTCDNVDLISEKIYKFIVESTDLLTSGVIGWQFVDHKKLLKSVPELKNFFYEFKLIPNSAAMVILTETGQLPVHVDELPVTAKINFPVINTLGWTNRWFSIDNDLLNNCPKISNQFGKQVEDLLEINQNEFKLIAEIHDLSFPIVFNSRIPHDVIKNSGNSPRIVASFTFYNEPVSLLS